MLENPVDGLEVMQAFKKHVSQVYNSMPKRKLTYSELMKAETQNVDEKYDDIDRLSLYLAYYKALLMTHSRKTDKETFEIVHSQLMAHLDGLLNSYNNEVVSKENLQSTFMQVLAKAKQSRIVPIIKQVISKADNYLQFMDLGNCNRLRKFLMKYEYTGWSVIRELDKRIKELEHSPEDIKEEEKSREMTVNQLLLSFEEMHPTVRQRELHNRFRQFLKGLTNTQKSSREMLYLVHTYFDFCLTPESFNEELILGRDMGYVIPQLAEDFKPKNADEQKMLDLLVNREIEIFKLVDFDREIEVEETVEEKRLQEVFMKMD